MSESRRGRRSQSLRNVGAKLELEPGPRVSTTTTSASLQTRTREAESHGLQGSTFRSNYLTFPGRVTDGYTDVMPLSSVKLYGG